MNSIPAQESKRRGIVAVDELLKNGPVDFIKNNRPRYVVMEEAHYTALMDQRHPTEPAQDHDIWDLVLNRRWEGSRSRESIDAGLRESAPHGARGDHFLKRVC